MMAKSSSLLKFASNEMVMMIANARKRGAVRIAMSAIERHFSRQSMAYCLRSRLRSRAILHASLRVCLYSRLMRTLALFMASRVMYSDVILVNSRGDG